MSDNGQRQLPSGLAGGRLEGISVPDLLWGLCRLGGSGVLSVTHDDTTKRVYIDEGNIVFATSSNPDDRLGETLLREDLITLDQLERAASRYGTGKRLGTILVEIAAITPQDLVNGVMQQIRDIILSLFPIEDGDYRFESGDLPTEELITVAMKMEELLLHGIRQVRSFSRVRRSVGPSRTRYRLTDQWEKISEGLGLNEGERTLLRHLDVSGRSVDELCNEVFLSNFEVYQALWAFKVLGAIQEAERAGGAPESVAVEGLLGSEGIAPILVNLCREGETGVIYISQNAVDRAIHIREGRCTFATSSNIDDGLISHLLRRGVISLRDREETARRLLSNKRVGTILREMGVIDETDLGDMVREQLREILLDTFQWDSGEFAFVPGELPTIEDITLEMSVEDIVHAGVGRVTSWSRVRQGCGGLDASLVLVNDYLRILDRMNVGQEEWEVVAALRTTKTATEVCRESSLGDFRTCQILWVFRLLGVAESCATDDEVRDEQQAQDAPAALEPVAVVAAEADALIEVEAAVEPADAHVTESETVTDPEVRSPRKTHEWPEPESEWDRVAASNLSSTDSSLENAEPGTGDEPAASTAADDEQRSTPQDAPALSIDSPHDATQYIPREFIEEALDGAPEEPEPEFEIGDPAEMPEPVAEWETREGTMVPEAVADAVPDDGDDPEVAALLGETEERSEAKEPHGDDLDESAIAALLTDEQGESETEIEPPEQHPEERRVAESVEEIEEIEEVEEVEEVEEPEESLVAELAAAEEMAEPQEDPDVSDLDTEDPILQAEHGGNGNGDHAWEPPDDLEALIARFNAMQRVVYRSIRSEVGAGATNFVRSCGGSLDQSFGDVFARVDLQPDGALDPGALREIIVEQRVERPWDGFQRMLDEEVDKLRIHIGEARASGLLERLGAIEA